MAAKPIWQSKIFWANALSVVVWVAGQYGITPQPLDPGIQLMLTAVLNIVLRFLTKQPVKVA